MQFNFYLVGDRFNLKYFMSALPTDNFIYYLIDIPECIFDTCSNDGQKSSNLSANCKAK